MAGQVARDREGRVVGRAISWDSSARSARTSGRRGRRGGALTHVVKLTIYVLDAAEYKRQARAIGGVYREYFGKHFPAMTLVGARDLYDAPEGCVLEIEAMALVPERSR